MKKKVDSRILALGVVAVILVLGLSLVSFGDHVSGAFSFSNFKKSLAKSPVLQKVPFIVSRSSTSKDSDVASLRSISPDRDLVARREIERDLPVLDWEKKPRPADLVDPVWGERCTKDGDANTFCDFECYDLSFYYEDVYFDEDCCNKQPWDFPLYCSQDVPGDDLCLMENLEENLAAVGTVFELDRGIRHINICLDDGRVRHVFCDENGFIYEDISFCREGTTCERGLCDGEESFVCFETDKENDKFKFGFSEYRDYFIRDRCPNKLYTTVSQVACLPVWQVPPGARDYEHFLYSEDFCSETNDLSSFCVDTFDELGICVKPSNYAPIKRDLEYDKFDSDLVRAGLKCSEKDGGENPYQAGVTKIVLDYEKVHGVTNVVLDNEVIRERRDYCYTKDGCDTGSVMEFFCAENEAGIPFLLSREIQCDEGDVCLDGECVDLKGGTCIDSDDGEDYYKKGNTFYGVPIVHEVDTGFGSFRRIVYEKLEEDYSNNDYCRGENRLREFYCNDEGFRCNNYYDLESDEGFCSNGKIVTCIDYDNMWEDNLLIDQAHKASSAKDLEMGAEHPDYCVGDLVAEMTCQNGHVVEEHVECERGYVCGNGDCDWDPDYDWDEENLVEVVE